MLAPVDVMDLSIAFLARDDIQAPLQLSRVSGEHGARSVNGPAAVSLDWSRAPLPWEMR